MLDTKLIAEHRCGDSDACLEIVTKELKKFALHPTGLAPSAIQ